MKRIRLTLRNYLKRIAERITRFRYLNRQLVLATDVALSCFSSIAAFTILLRVAPWMMEDVSVWSLAGASLLFSGAFLYLSKVYQVIIRYMSFQDVSKFFQISVLKGVCVGIIYHQLVGHSSFMGVFSFVLFDTILTFSSLLMIRSSLVTIYYWITNQPVLYKQRARVLIYGSSEGSTAIGRSLLFQRNRSYKPVAYCEVSDTKKPIKLNELSVIQLADQTEFENYISIHNIEGIIFPSEEQLQEEVGRLVEWCMQHEVDMFVIPHMERTHGESRKQIREVNIEDLLGRKRIILDTEEVDALLTGKRVLVSGAAGSIGSEIVRQLCKQNIKELTCYDNAETPLHNLELEIRATYPDVPVEFILGDVRSKKRISAVFKRKKPQLVYHAAAYKHVPMIERNPCEAVLVNVLGTKNMAEMAVEYGVERFVMVSTDKAVRPTNVMGATKRLAEMFVQSFNVLPTSQKTIFVTTRFGNVLGSNGSVIPLFKEQIQKGGPITVTHPDITRYFMTIPEACRLVLQASAMSKGGEIFVFDMGEPVKIADLAKRMIRLAGLREGIDIDVVYSGLRPGEKLYEELLTDEESTTDTQHGKIHRAIVSPVEYEPLEAAIQELIALSQQVEIEGSVRMIKALVPDFISNNSVFEGLDKKNIREQIIN
ncbi:MAG: polysaccharide biosynthesis protein [Phocaeicola sp.]